MTLCGSVVGLLKKLKSGKIEVPFSSLGKFGELAGEVKD